MTTDPTSIGEYVPSFQDLIDEALGHEEEMARLDGSRPDRPRALLAMPEMQAIRSCIAALASLHYNEGYLSIKPEQVHRLRAGLAAGGGLPECVIDWVLS